MTEEMALAEKIGRQRNVHTYMRSNHPDVLAAWEDCKTRWEAFCDAGHAWAEKYSGQRVFMSIGNMLRKTECSGLPSDKVDPSKLVGKWKKPARGCIAPYANNPAAKEAPEYQGVRIPGRPSLFWGGGRMGSGALFEHEGYLYSHVRIRDEYADDEIDAEVMDAYGWEGLRGSEYLAAQEAMEDQRGKDS